ncbi:hypothetical protein EJ07DRAFT_151853 [Lizonia empirigonia]|nr:hypothetical protein EJ07DRAFT_151853 [Lizonia empirigonia]
MANEAANVLDAGGAAELRLALCGSPLDAPVRLPAANAVVCSYTKHSSEAFAQHWQRLVAQSPTHSPGVSRASPTAPSMFPEIAAMAPAAPTRGTQASARKKPTSSSISVCRLRTSGTPAR